MMPRQSKARIAKGARVMLSSAGRAVLIRGVVRVGTVTGYGRDGVTCWVLWDGLRSPQPWHFEYLAPVDAPLTPAPPPA